MFHHIVLLRFTPDSTPDQHRAVAEGLRPLPESIPDLRTYEVHLDAGLGAQNAQVSVHATFDDEAGWHAYSNHPAHVQVIDQRITPILETALRTQYADDGQADRS
ncbi:MAG TPA: Dabb family protein [Acidimicrobiales bacterium]|nr:Dabb family protein [Acidimicrobiales bacterium]